MRCAQPDEAGGERENRAPPPRRFELGTTHAKRPPPPSQILNIFKEIIDDFLILYIFFTRQFVELLAFGARTGVCSGRSFSAIYGPAYV